MTPLLHLPIVREEDVVSSRQRSKQLAKILGFEEQDQSKIATAVSELTRNAILYAEKGSVDFYFDLSTEPQQFVIIVEDKGKGIENLDRVLEGRYKSKVGMGLGLIGTQRLMDDFKIESSAKGTKVEIRKNVHRLASQLDAENLNEAIKKIKQLRARDPIEVLIDQNGELAAAMFEIQRKQEELQTLNCELEDTNRGVVALYAELDERAEHLRQADELKSKFLSNMSHEFRTPLNSIIALSRILLDHIDGPLTDEQQVQLQFILKATLGLSELVNDLLDLAKVEAGKITISPTEFEVSSLFGALRGMLRPLLVTDSVRLIFDDPQGIPSLFTDEAKVSQILRNLISNALKYTESGEVRITARYIPESSTVEFSVADTGIGVAEEDYSAIFEEFRQLDHSYQHKVKGTGLGLPLSRELARLLGGTLTVKSKLGEGSEFVAAIPLHYRNEEEVPAEVFDFRTSDDKRSVLIVEDREEDMLIYQKLLAGSGFQPFPVYTIRQAEDALTYSIPSVIVLDVVLKGETGWQFLKNLRENPAHERIPVFVITVVEDAGRAYALGAKAFMTKPLLREAFLAELRRITHHSTKALVVDDEEISRYLLRQLLDMAAIEHIEAPSGEQALKLAIQERPDIIFLDLMMPGMGGKQAARLLKEDERTKDIPIVVVTSKVLNPEEARELNRLSVDIMTKDMTTREAGFDRLKVSLGKAGITL